MPRSRSKSTTSKGTGRKSAIRKSTIRKSTSKTSSLPANASKTAKAETFVCPECGKAFSRAASLGAHRNRAHGVAGRSTQGSPANPRARNAATTTSRALVTSATRVDRDALLGALFPNGIPARESVIRDLNAWLDQAERLARQG